MDQDENLNLNNSLESEKSNEDEHGQNFQEQETTKTSVMGPHVGMEFESHQEVYSYYLLQLLC